jgi:RNA polymerase sigma-70 factor (ECF subfamily)
MNQTTDDAGPVHDWIADYGTLVFSVCIRVLKDREAALDVSQRVWELVIRNRLSFRGDSKPSTWIYAIAYREAAREAKKERRIRYRELVQGYHDARYQPNPGDLDGDALYDWLSEKCNRCLTGVLLTLEFRPRVIFTFRYVLDLPFSEIARILGMNEASARKAASRARTALAEFLRTECGLFGDATPCRCGLEGALDRTSFRKDISALRSITRIARTLHERGEPLPTIEYWEKIRERCHEKDTTPL